jgi:hypothetical protein
LELLPRIAVGSTNTALSDRAFAAVLKGTIEAAEPETKAHWLLALGELQLQRNLDRLAYESLTEAWNLGGQISGLNYRILRARGQAAARPAVAECLKLEEEQRRREAEDRYSPADWAMRVSVYGSRESDFSLALAALDRLLTHPEAQASDLAHPIILMSMTSSDRLSLVEKVFRGHLDRSAHRVPLLVGLARIEHRFGRPERALDLIVEGLERDPGTVVGQGGYQVWVDTLMELHPPAEVSGLILEVFDTKGCGEFGELAYQSFFRSLPQPRDKELLRTTVAALELRAQAESDTVTRAFLLTAAANTWIELGDFERGERSCRRAMALDRERVTRARYHLARLGRQP